MMRASVATLTLCLAAAPAFGQGFSVPLPGLVLRDANSAMVGQVFPQEQGSGWVGALVLVSNGTEKALLTAFAFGNLNELAGLNWVYYQSGNCTGQAVMEIAPFDSTFDHMFEKRTGIGTDGVVYQVTPDSLTCSSSIVLSKTIALHGTCTNYMSGFDLSTQGQCYVAEPTGIDLDGLVPPFRIE